MANSPQIATLAGQIAAISITSPATLTVWGLNQVGNFAEIARQAPVMLPDPEGFVEGFGAVRLGMGPASSASYQYTYTLKYTVVIAPMANGRGLNEAVPSLVDWAAAIVGYFAGHDDQFVAQEITCLPVDKFIVISDGAGGEYMGFNLAIEIEDY